MKKSLILLLILLLVVNLTGCAASGIQLTEEETDAIAQYSAYLILKYDNRQNAEQKLLEHKTYDELMKEINEVQVEQKVTSVPDPTGSAEPSSEVTAKPTEAPKVTESPKPTEIPAVTDKPAPTETPEPTPSGSESGSGTTAVQYTLNDIFNTRNFEISYSDYLRTDVFEGTLSAPKGKEVLVLYFNIKNVSDSKQKFVSSNYRVNFKLKSGKAEISPEYSLTLNDIQFLNDEIAPGKVFKSILVFFIEKDKTGDYKLVASNGEGSITSTTKITIK